MRHIEPLAPTLGPGFFELPTWWPQFLAALGLVLFTVAHYVLVSPAWWPIDEPAPPKIDKAEYNARPFQKPKPLTPQLQQSTPRRHAAAPPQAAGEEGTHASVVLTGVGHLLGSVGHAAAAAAGGIGKVVVKAAHIEGHRVGAAVQRFKGLTHHGVHITTFALAEKTTPRMAEASRSWAKHRARDDGTVLEAAALRKVKPLKHGGAIARALVSDETKAALPEAMVRLSLAATFVQTTQDGSPPGETSDDHTATITSGHDAPLPSAAAAFVGSWQLVSNEHYDEFLQTLGLGWATRKIALKIALSPTFSIAEEAGREVLACQTLCIGAKPVYETLSAGESTFTDPNLKTLYTVTADWRLFGKKLEYTPETSPDTYVTIRRSAAINGGRPTMQSRRIDENDRLVIKQEWGHPQGLAYVSTYRRAA